MTNVFFATIEGQLSSERLLKLINSLPDSMRNSVLRYKHWKDTLLVLFGKLILDKACRDLFQLHDVLNEIQYNEYKRPIHPNLNFNISHSENVVVVAISEDVRLGIDIEKVKPIDIHEFENVFSDEENIFIKNSSYPIQTFYKFWTKKEAAIKADGMGMHLSLKQINILENDSVNINGVNWHIQNLAFKDDYVCHVACNSRGEKIKIQQVNL